MSEQAAEHSRLSFGIHENNAFSATGAIPLKISLSSLFTADLKSEKWMTGQSHTRGFNHVVMKGNLAHDELLRGLEQEEWSSKARTWCLFFTASPPGSHWKYINCTCIVWQWMKKKQSSCASELQSNSYVAVNGIITKCSWTFSFAFRTKSLLKPRHCMEFIF